MLEPLTDVSKHIKQFLLDNPEIDGIFTINDSMAYDVIGVAEALGRKIPSELQIIGFDGERTREGAPYQVSTIAQPIREMAEMAVTLLIDVIAGKTVEKRTVLPIKFAEGGTTKVI